MTAKQQTVRIGQIWIHRETGRKIKIYSVSPGELAWIVATDATLAREPKYSDDTIQISTRALRIRYELFKSVYEYSGYAISL